MAAHSDAVAPPDGVVTLIWRADGLADVLVALAQDFGAVSILPVYPKPDAPAIRVLARAVKASRAPLTLRPGLGARRGGRHANGAGRSASARKFSTAD